MSLSLFRKIAKYAVFRALFIGIMGTAALLFPEFLERGMVYLMAGYIILNGVIGVLDFVLEKGAEKAISYLNVFLAGISIVCGILCIIYFRYLVSIRPVFFGAFLFVEGIVYFVAALCAKSRWKALLVILAFLTAFGGAVLVLFTFGFGGPLALSRMFGGFLFFSCISELSLYLMYKNTVKIGEA